MAIELKVIEGRDGKFPLDQTSSGNYADMARAFGGHGERVTEPGEIVPALQGAMEEPRRESRLLEFITEKAVDFSIFP